MMRKPGGYYVPEYDPTSDAVDSVAMAWVPPCFEVGIKFPDPVKQRIVLHHAHGTIGRLTIIEVGGSCAVLSMLTSKDLKKLATVPTLRLLSVIKGQFSDGAYTKPVKCMKRYAKNRYITGPWEKVIVEGYIDPLAQW